VSTSAFAALRVRDFTLLIVAGPLILSAAILAQEVAIGYALYQRTGDPLTLGLIGLAEAVPYLGVAMYGGAIADRLPRKRIILCAVALILAGSFALDLLMRHADTLSTPALLASVYGAVALVGFARGFYGPALSALRASLIPPVLYANASAWSATSFQAGAVLGPLIAGFLYAPIGLAGTLATVVAMVATSLALIACVRAPPTPPTPSGESIRTAIAEGLRFVFGSRPDHLRGRVLAVNGLFVTCSNEIGAFESGAAARVMGLRASILAGAAVTLGTLAWLGWKTRDLLRAEREGRAAEAA
jgi:MFS family permease